MRRKKKKSDKQESLPPSPRGRGKTSFRTGRPKGKGGGWSEWLASRGPVVRFVGLFTLLIIVFYAIFLPLSGEEGPFRVYLNFLASMCGWILRLLGHDTTVTGPLIASPDFSIEIVRGCDGIEATALFSAAVLASPVALRLRLPFLLAGIAALVCVNIVRAVTLFCIGVSFPKAFERIHFEAWPGVLIVAVMCCWLAWARWAAKRQGLHANGSV